jgi:replicative superfamily II helicase
MLSHLHIYALRAVLRCLLQIIGMSATLPNVADVAHWLDAQCYSTDYRPVPLQHYMKVGATIRDANNQVRPALVKMDAVCMHVFSR